MVYFKTVIDGHTTRMNKNHYNVLHTAKQKFRIHILLQLCS